MGLRRFPSSARGRPPPSPRERKCSEWGNHCSQAAFGRAVRGPRPSRRPHPQSIPLPASVVKYIRARARRMRGIALELRFIARSIQFLRSLDVFILSGGASYPTIGEGHGHTPIPS